MLLLSIKYIESITHPFWKSRKTLVSTCEEFLFKKCVVYSSANSWPFLKLENRKSIGDYSWDKNVTIVSHDIEKECLVVVVTSNTKWSYKFGVKPTNTRKQQNTPCTTIELIITGMIENDDDDNWIQKHVHQKQQQTRDQLTNWSFKYNMHMFQDNSYVLCVLTFLAGLFIW